MRDIPAGGRWGGSPARPIREWLRSSASLERRSGANCGKREAGQAASEPKVAAMKNESHPADAGICQGRES